MAETSYPNTRPPDTPEQLRGQATVESKTGMVYMLNFDLVECDCKYGSAWRWQSNRWVPNNYCNHKLKAVSSLIEAGDESLRDFYQTMVGKRVNAFVCVSAFHKELRRGDQEKALYWATCLIPHRGKHGVIAYMRNIVFEETRDLQLAKYILRLSEHGRSVSELDMQNAVRRFCRAPKKWELPWRYEVFMDEMRGYRKVAEEFGYEVAAHKDILPAASVGTHQKRMLEGFKNGDRPLMQAGLKAWYKSKNKHGTERGHDEMRIEIFNCLVDVQNGLFPNKFKHDPDYCNRLQVFVLRRIETYGSPGYHELNAFADALSEPREADPAASLTSLQHKRLVNSPRLYTLPLGDFRNPPLYAHDNHTWNGKALMRSYGAAELQPRAKQEKLDFRLCGAYMGVAWRILAYKQHGTIDVGWHEVSWERPNWLWSHLDKMWYVLPWLFLGVSAALSYTYKFATILTTIAGIT